jgi:GR25 family glycosyltransferase involved in LPS biosynthesis
MKTQNRISTFIINLKKRGDRKKHILSQFKSRPEFILTIKQAVEHDHGSIGLWLSICDIINNLTQKEDFILICEDDHEFTDQYKADLLFQCIEDAKTKEADVVLGGVSWLSSVLEVSKNLAWIDDFSGLQFTIIFKKFFKTILNAEFKIGQAADYKISSLTNNKYLIYPFISIQKEFGYSDVTTNNNKKGQIVDLFVKSDACIKLLRRVHKFYSQYPGNNEMFQSNYEDLMIPVYVINNHTDNPVYLKSILDQFEDKIEFAMTVVDSNFNENANMNKWITFKKIISLAIENDDDLIVICEDDHVFTENYSKEFLFRNIFEAFQQGADYLSGGSASFTHPVQISENRFWIDTCLFSSFSVIYKNFYRKILEEPPIENRLPEIVLSLITANKMLLYPFISKKKLFPAIQFPTITSLSIYDESFLNSEKRLDNIDRFTTLYRTVKSNDISID